MVGRVRGSFMESPMRTKPFCRGSIGDAKVFVIGHDPRLQNSRTIAEYAFFANYYFEFPGSMNAKCKLAKSVFDYITYLTAGRYSLDQILLTNLCNTELPRPGNGKTVYISESDAKRGLNEIQNLLSKSSIELIFAMSMQVNYWLQKLKFYPTVSEFLAAAKPSDKGIAHDPPYYKPVLNYKWFVLICGKQYRTNDGRKLIPIHHVKRWPGAIHSKQYFKNYEECVLSLRSL